MSLNTTNVLKNLNGIILFFFFILFTAPLGADDAISGNESDDRRRSSKGTVVVKLLSHSEPSLAQSNSTAQDRETTGASLPDSQTQNVSCGLQPGNDPFGKVPDPRAEIESFKTINETQSSNNQWIGTVISETGPPSFPENPPSHLFGHDNNGRLPQVAIIQIPDIVSQNVFYRINRKILSVRSPTGPPDSLESNNTARYHPPGLISSPSTSHLDQSFRIPIYSRGMQVMLRGAPVRMST